MLYTFIEKRHWSSTEMINKTKLGELNHIIKMHEMWSKCTFITNGSRHTKTAKNCYETITCTQKKVLHIATYQSGPTALSMPYSLEVLWHLLGREMNIHMCLKADQILSMYNWDEPDRAPTLASWTADLLCTYIIYHTVLYVIIMIILIITVI